MKRPHLIAIAITGIFSLALLAETVNGAGLLSRFAGSHHRMPTSNPAVTFEQNRDGSVVFYSAVQPFHGVAITPDGRNVYVGN